jgi:hypothetical protein
MENTVESFVVYKSFYEAIKNLEKQDDQLELYNAMFEYCLYGNEPNLTGVCSIMWTLIKPQLDSNIKRRMDGKKGGAPKGNNNAKKQPKTTIVDLENNHRLIQKQPNVNVNENVNVNVNENVNVNVNKNDNVNVNKNDNVNSLKVEFSDFNDFDFGKYNNL